MGKQPLNHLQIKRLQPTGKKQKLACGDALYLIVEPIHKSKNGKSFSGIMRFPPTKDGKQIEVRIGKFGDGVNEWSLKSAREEWIRLRHLSRERGLDPREIRKQEKPIFKVKDDEITIGYAADKWIEVNTTYGLAKEKVWTASTTKDYKNRIYNQILNPEDGGFDRETPLSDFAWSNGGRTKVMEMREHIQKRGALRQANRNFRMCKHIFEYAIDRGWMMEPNPAKTSKEISQPLKVKHNPHLKWEELDRLCNVISNNPSNSQPEVIAAVRFALLCFLRVSTISKMEYKELDEKKNIWRVPYQKMKYQGTRDEDFIVPLTKQMWMVIDQMKSISSQGDYVFFSPRGKDRHINPSSINAFLKRNGYKGKLTAHGMRGTVLTANEEVLGFEKHIVRIQLSHKLGDKVERAYNHATYWGKRVEFMEYWSNEMEKKGLFG